MEICASKSGGACVASWSWRVPGAERGVSFPGWMYMTWATKRCAYLYEGEEVVHGARPINWQPSSDK